MQFSDLQSALVKSINDKQRLKIVYHGEERTVEVHAVGISTSGNPVCRVYQIIGGAVFGAPTGWKMMKLSDIESLEILPENFTTREGYSPGDKGMSAILAEL